MSNGKIQVELQEWMGSDRRIAESAWTSSYLKEAKEARGEDDVRRVIKEMAAQRHGTPFESVIFRFWIKMPTFTDRQHMTHRIASHNGLSGRYRTLPHEWFGLPEDVVEIMNRFGYLGDVSKGTVLGEVMKGEYDDICRQAFDFYKKSVAYCKEMRDAGQLTQDEFKRVRESVRGVIPVANMTERTTIMNLRSFANYQRQRNDPHAQPEIRLVAQEMIAQVIEKDICPIAIEELARNGWTI